VDVDDHYWAKSGIQHFNGASSFYLPSAVTDAFGNQTSIGYDTYKLFVTQVTAPLSLATTAVIDYRVLAPNKSPIPTRASPRRRSTSRAHIHVVSIQKNGFPVGEIDEGGRLRP
jgi:hypothetical protein